VSKKAKTEYTALVGFDVDEGRWEAGESFVEGEIDAKTVKQLLKDGDAEVKNGDSKN